MGLNKSWLNRSPRKLKHLTLKGIYYKLLNTSCIFTCNRSNNCSCDQFQGCWLKPLWHTIDGKRNYCYVCRVGVTYNADRIQKLTKIADIFDNYREIKKDIQLCITFDPECDEFWMYHYRTSGKGRFGFCYWCYLKNYIDECYYYICEQGK